MDFVVVAIGVFAIAEVLASIDAGDKARMLPVPKGMRNLLPSWEELKACRFAFINGSITGFIIGVLPGAGAAISSFIAYGIEKAFSKHPEKFGQGVPEGVAAPEGANNADSGGALVPLLTLGIPGGGTTAIMLSALVLWGVRPGPLLMTESPDMFWGLVASMYIGNVVLLILNLPLVPLFAQILRLPVHILFPIILGISLVGAYGVSGRLFDIGLLVGFGLLGYIMVKLKYPTRAADPRLRARRRDGTGVAAVAHDVAGRSHHLGAGLDIGHHAGLRGPDPAAAADGPLQQGPRAGDRRRRIDSASARRRV